MWNKREGFFPGEELEKVVIRKENISGNDHFPEKTKSKDEKDAGEKNML